MDDYSVGEEEGSTSDAGSDIKLISSDKKARDSPEVETMEEGDAAASTSNQNTSGTPPKAEREEEGEQDSEQDDPTGKFII